MRFSFLSKSVLLIVLLICACSCSFFYSLPSYASDFHGDVIYQIFTDRFANGDPSNDDPEVSKGMFDKSKKNWHAYWGGDLRGVRQKLPYIKAMGFTAIWISPVIDNVNKPTIDGKGVVMAPYHGYHARDFRAIDEHIGDWKEFDLLIKDAHAQGIKVMVDMPLNHTSTINHGEFGALYSGTEFMSDTENDRNKYFHHLPLITDWNDPYQLQYYTLMWLGDLNQESSYVHNYLNDAVLKLQKHGADGTRLDAAKHTNWGWQHTVVNKLQNKGEHFVVAEWWMSDTKDPIYKDGVKFANKAGTGMFDFPFATVVRKILGSKSGASFKLLSQTIEQEYKDFNDCNSLVTFIDNHDMARFLSLNDDKQKLHLALGLMFLSRGIPSMYYGTEQYLHDDTKGGGDPYTRAWMKDFNLKSPGSQLVKRLNQLRASNESLRSGKQETVFVNDDLYVFKRAFGEDQVLVAVNKNSKKDRTVTLADLTFPKGKYKDKLENKMNGVSLELANDGDSAKLSLPPNSISVWAAKMDNAKPSISSVMPNVVNGGVPVNVYGKCFGSSRGKVLFKDHPVTISHWTDEKITFDAPAAKTGLGNLTVVRSDQVKSTKVPFSILKKKLIPITLQVKGAPVKLKSQKLFVTGDTHSLGLWSHDSKLAAGPMLYSEDRDFILCIPMPASSKVKLKLFVTDKKGKIIKEESGGHTIKVQDSGPWRHKLKWED